MDPPLVLTDLHSTAAAMKGPGDEHNQDAYGEQRRGAIAVGGCPDLNGAACSARTEMERASERMEFLRRERNKLGSDWAGERRAGCAMWLHWRNPLGQQCSGGAVNHGKEWLGRTILISCWWRRRNRGLREGGGGLNRTGRGWWARALFFMVVQRAFAGQLAWARAISIMVVVVWVPFGWSRFDFIFYSQPLINYSRSNKAVKCRRDAQNFTLSLS